MLRGYADERLRGRASFTHFYSSRHRASGRWSGPEIPAFTTPSIAKSFRMHATRASRIHWTGRGCGVSAHSSVCALDSSIRRRRRRFVFS